MPSVEVQLEALRGDVRLLNQVREQTEAKLSDRDQEISDLREDLELTKAKLDKSTNDFKTFRAQIHTGYAVVAFIGSLIMGGCYLIYDMVNGRFPGKPG